MNNQNYNAESAKPAEEQIVADSPGLSGRLGTIGWALFFIWIGVSYLGNFGIGVVLLGVGIITLAMQLVRRSYNLRLEGFWVIVGLLFFLGGLWELFKPDLPLVPILLFAVGMILLISAIWGKRHVKK
jgi:hypothetical protein